MILGRSREVEFQPLGFVLGVAFGLVLVGVCVVRCGLLGGLSLLL